MFRWFTFKLLPPAPTRCNVISVKEHCSLVVSFYLWLAPRSLEVIFDTLLLHYARNWQRCFRKVEAELLSSILAQCTKLFLGPGPTTELGHDPDAGGVHPLGWEHWVLVWSRQQLGGRHQGEVWNQLPQVGTSSPVLSLTRSTSSGEGCLGGLGKIRLRHHSTKLDGEGMRIKVDLNLFGFVLIDVNK